MLNMSRKSMALFLRDIGVAIEIGLRDYRTGNFAPDSREYVKGHLSGLEQASRLAYDAIARVGDGNRVPTDITDFLEQIDREARARLILSEPERVIVAGVDFPEAKRPSDQALFEETMRMFHECALLGEMPDPRLSPRE